MTRPSVPDDRTEPTILPDGGGGLDFLAPPAAPGQLGVLGPYEVHEVLSGGPQGVVLKGFEPRLRRFVAIKVLAPALAANPAARTAFLGRARVAAAISHENVVALHAVVEEPFPYLVMEYVPGQSLQERLDAAGPLPLVEALTIARQTAAGLAALHAQGQAHGGVRPGNILLEAPAARVKLTPAGVPPAAEQPAALAYLSPEQVAGQPAGAHSDLFSLGCVLYALGTGASPFRAEGPEAILKLVAQAQPRPVGEINPDVPAWLAGLLTRLMAREPERRPTAGEVVELLDGHLHRLQMGAGVPSPVRPRRRWWPAIVVVGAVLLAGLALAGTAGWTRWTGRSSEGRHERRLTLAVPRDSEPAGNPGPTSTPPRYNEWVALFNGKDLSGWKRWPGDLGEWRVEAGLLTGSGPGSYLFSERGDYGDFHLRAELRINARGNSGLCFRTPTTVTTHDLRAEADIYNGPGIQVWMTGALWAVRHVPFADALAAPDAWYTHEVIARGKHLVVKVNGRTTADLYDDPSEVLEGHFALQARSAWTVVQFRKIEVMELPRPRPARSLDELKREHIRAEELLVAGNGDPARAPQELVAVLGSNRLKSWGNNLAVAFSPDSQLLATAGTDAVVRLHDALNGRQVGVLAGHSGTIRGLAFSPLGTHLATAGEDGTVKVWDVAARKVVEPIAHAGPVVAVAWSSAGRLATACGKVITVRDPESAPIAAPRRPSVTLTHEQPVHCLAFSPDGKRLAAGGDVSASPDSDGYFAELKVWNVETGKLVVQIDEHTGPVWSVAFSPDGKHLVCGAGHVGAGTTPGAGREVKLFDTAAWEEMWSIPCPGNAVLGVGFSADGKRVVSVQRDTVKVWDAATGTKAIDLEGYLTTATAAAFSRDGKRLATGLLQYVHVRRAATGQVLLHGHEAGGGFSVAFSPDGTKLAGGTWAAPTIRDPRTGARVLPLQNGHTGTAPGVAFSADGRFLATGGNDRTVKVHETATGKNVLTLSGHTNNIWSVAFSPDGRMLASGGMDRTVKVWDLLTGKERHSFAGHEETITMLAFSPDSKRLASASLTWAGRPDGVLLWDLGTGQRLHTLGKSETGLGVAFSPDGRKVLCGGRRLTLWDADRGKLLRSVEGHPDWVRGIAFSPDGRALATAGNQGHVLVWDAAALTVRRRWKLPWEVVAVAFAPEGRHLATMNANGTIYLLRLPAPNASAKRR